MSESFDPYRQWLGLDITGTPASHYQLLDLDLYEEDTERIINHSDSAMTQIRRHRPGKHAQRWTQLLDEVASAKKCLTDSRNKSIYDTQLRQGISPNSVDLTETPPALTSSTRKESDQKGTSQPQAIEESLQSKVQGTDVSSTAAVDDLSETPFHPMAPYVPISSDDNTHKKEQSTPSDANIGKDALELHQKDHLLKGSSLEEESIVEIPLSAGQHAATKKRSLTRYPLWSVVFAILGLTVVATVLCIALLNNGDDTDIASNKENDQNESAVKNTKDNSRQQLLSNNQKNSDPARQETENRSPDISRPQRTSALPTSKTLSRDELATLSRHLKAVRQSLTKRNLPLAAEEMVKAKRLSSGTRHEDMTERLDLLRIFVEQFWGEFEKAKNSLRPTQELTLGKDEITNIITVTPQKIVLQRRGLPFAYEMQHLPFPIVLAIADQWLSENEIATELVKGAIQAVDPRGSSEKARQIWQQVYSEETEVEDLIQTLEDDYDL